MRIAVLGKGAWGNALASVVSENHRDVVVWGRGDPFPKADVLVISVPTQAIREVLSLKSPEDKPWIVNCSKGIERETNKLPVEVVFEVCGDSTKYFSLMGPSFSKEVIDKMPTLVNLGSFGQAGEEAEQIRQAFQTDFFRVRITSGILSMELSAALKNFYAVACGIAEGLHYGQNTRAKLIAIAIEETYRLCDGLSYQRDDHATAGIIGDFLLTCNSMESRNFKFGTLLAENSAEKARKIVGATVEGYNTCASMPEFLKRAGVDLPLAHFILDAVKLEGKEKLKARFMEFEKEV